MGVRQTSRQNRRRVFSFNPPPLLEVRAIDTALYGDSNPNMILKGSKLAVSAKQAPRVRPFAKPLISQGE
jgi:hypothetical protein